MTPSKRALACAKEIASTKSLPVLWPELEIPAAARLIDAAIEECVALNYALLKANAALQRTEPTTPPAGRANMSSEVKRYNEYYGCGLVPEPDGAWVSSDYYDQAIAERDALRAEVERLKLACDEQREAINLLEGLSAAVIHERDEAVALLRRWPIEETRHVRRDTLAYLTRHDAERQSGEKEGSEG
jgi:hypothetical protein